MVSKDNGIRDGNGLNLLRRLREKRGNSWAASKVVIRSRRRSKYQKGVTQAAKKKGGERDGLKLDFFMKVPATSRGARRGERA